MGETAKGRPHIEPVAYTVPEAAELLNASENSVRAMCRMADHPIPSYRVGNQLRIRKSSLDRWMAEEEQLCKADHDA